MFTTGTYTHAQDLDLVAGFYKYNIQCVDAGGNVAQTNTNFTVFVDNQAPIVTRVYREQALKLVTNEDAQCTYALQNCNFNLDDGLKLEYQNDKVKNQLFVDWKSTATYYVKCVDKYGNQPDPASCSVIVSPKETLLAKDTTSS